MPISSLVLEILNIHHILGAKRSLFLEILNTYYKYNVSQKELILEKNIHYYYKNPSSLKAKPTVYPPG